MDPDGLYGEGRGEDAEQEARSPAIVMDALVEGAEDAVETNALEERLHAAQERARGASEEEKREHDRAEDEDPLEPEVGAHVETPDREHERDGAEENRRGPAEPAFEHHGSGGDGGPPTVSAGGLDDPHSVSSERGRQHLAGGVGDEVGAGTPAEASSIPCARSEPSPAAAAPEP